MNSIRRFVARPSSVTFGAIGCDSPNPIAAKRAGSIPRATRAERTASARCWLRIWLVSLSPSLSVCPWISIRAPGSCVSNAAALSTATEPSFVISVLPVSKVTLPTAASCSERVGWDGSGVTVPSSTPPWTTTRLSTNWVPSTERATAPIDAAMVGSAAWPTITMVPSPSSVIVRLSKPARSSAS